MSTPAETLVNGSCDEPFAAVRRAFAENFANRDELGAAVCVYHDGRKVVDLWGGHKDPQRTQPWDEDTIVCMMSVGKGVAAICSHVLIDRGELDIAKPVAHYWPEFVQAGKQDITVEQLIAHHAALVYPDLAPPDSLWNWDVMVDALERQAPAWEPGTIGAYHSSTYGHLVGELIRRVDGRTIGAFLREEIAAPLGLDYAFGLNDEQIARTIDLQPHPDSATSNAINDPDTKLYRAWRPLLKQPHWYNTEQFRRIEFPSANGHGNARAIARLFATLSLGGAIDGAHILRPETVDLLRAQRWDNPCGLTDRPFRMALGLHLNSPGYMPMGPNPASYGHAGLGGALGFADPDAHIAFSYCTNAMCAGEGVGDRCQALIDATFG